MVGIKARGRGWRNMFRLSEVESSQDEGRGTQVADQSQQAGAEPRIVFSVWWKTPRRS